MDSSSEDSLAWARLTDDSEDSELDSPMNNHSQKPILNNEDNEKAPNNNYEDLSPEKKIKKRKLKFEPPDSENSIDSPKKKKMKLEEIEDIYIKKKKSHKKDKQNSCETLDFSEDNDLEDYDYLNMKVKQEQDNCKKETVSKAKHNKKSFSETEDNHSINDTDFSEKEEKKIKIKDKHILETHSLLSDEEKPTNSPKKRKSKKRKETTDESNDENFIIEDKFSAEETEVQKIPAHPTSYNNGEIGDMASNNKVKATDNTDSYSDDDSKSHNFTDNDHNNSRIEHENINSPKIKGKNNSPKIKEKNNSLKFKEKNNSSKIKEKNAKNNSTSGNSISSTNSVSEQSHVTPRILDRIRFEDESDSEKSPNCTNKKSYSSDLKRFLKGKPSLQPVSEKMQKIQEITDNDELWILKCPHKLDVVDFRSKDFILDSKSKIKINGETFIGNLDEDIGRLTVMTTEKEKFVIKNVKVNGVIALHKRLPKPHVVEHNMIANYQTDFIPLPEIKCRHPLFGSNYKSSLKVPRSIAQRLVNDENISTAVNYDKKKKKKHKKELNGELDDNINIKPKIEVDGPTKKNKKRKHDHDSETSKKKTKRIKQEPDSSDVWESEKAIEENLFNF